MDTPQMPRELPNGTVTLLFTDIEGSTRLLRQLGTDGYAEALAEHRRVLRDAFAAEGGVEVDTQGDAFFVAFPTAAGAVAAAAAGAVGTRAGARSRCGWVSTPAHRRSLRKATSGSTSTAAPASPLSRTAARWSSRATTAALVDDQPLRDLGRHRLKDFDAPAQLFQLGPQRLPTAAHARRRRPAHARDQLPRARARALRRREPVARTRSARADDRRAGWNRQDPVLDRAGAISRRRGRRRHHLRAARTRARRCARRAADRRRSSVRPATRRPRSRRASATGRLT